MNKLFFLSFFLCIATLKSSEFTLIKSTIDLQKACKLVDKYDEDLAYPFFKENHGLAIHHIKRLEKYKTKTFEGYSFLGLAAIAINVYPKDLKHIYPQLASYKERKEFIGMLRKHGFMPTQKDRSLALIVEQEAGIYNTNGKSDLFDSDLSD